ncbi:MAG: hypothetical protein CVV23_06250 [Ignavibacteriae bacterium HGW-Ignavibacteriae-2]|jgi:N-acetylmuramoyl-L-alanine amidase|nr:MAG: hypothetical protein CVV23_06250 [Ignavibacteriae bacterium HGW-Ignavibacteriae-2]
MTNKFLLFILSCVFIALNFIGCSSSEYVNRKDKTVYDSGLSPYYEIPTALTDSSKIADIISDYSKFLKGKKIIIDPGHGGADRKNSNRDGSVIEADINLDVALYLKSFLIDAEAEVLMTRSSDQTVSLDDRSKIANSSSADLFLSIHHNTTSDKMDYRTNYTSTFYHARENDYDYEPYEHQIAKYIQRDLAYAMRNSGGLASFDGTISDYLIYEGDGFAVLRNTKIPAVLIECSFITNRFEEKRLGIKEFNEIQAWGIFNGLAKFFKNKIPSINLIQDKCEYTKDQLKLFVTVDDPFPLNVKSINVWYNKSEIDFDVNPIDKNIEIYVQNPIEGEYELKVVYADKRGFYAKPFNRKILIK